MRGLIIFTVFVATAFADLSNAISLQATGSSGEFSIVCAGSPVTYETATVSEIEVWAMACVFATCPFCRRLLFALPTALSFL